jgi:hypothetical protein
MGEVIHSAGSQKLSLSLFLATMDEVIHSAPWRPGMKSSLVPVALLQKDWNTSTSQEHLSILQHCC